MLEKLIKLLKKTPISEINGHIAEAEVCFMPHVFARMAKHLIANGVTIPVRCKDCKHWKHFEHVGCNDFLKVCGLANYMIGENGYCLYGERKDNG